MSTCGNGMATYEEHLLSCSHPESCDYVVYGPARIAYTGSALKHPGSTTEFVNRTLRRRAKNKLAKQSRRKNR
jgi:hypothetical protein